MSRPLVIYITPYDILRPRTNQLSDVRFTEGFVQNGCDAHLIVPYVEREDNIPEEEVHFVYGLKEKPNIHFLGTRYRHDIHGKKQLANITLKAVRKVFTLLRHSKRYHHSQKTYIISRSTHLIYPFFILRKIFPRLFRNVFIIHWAHDFHSRNPYKRIYRWSDFLLATNSSILKSILELTGRDQLKCDVTLNPITQAQAEEVISRDEARRETGLEEISSPLIVYTGKIGLNYDLEIKKILEAAGQLPEYTFLMTGGKPDAIEFWKDYCTGKKIENVIFTGYIHDYRRIRFYQYAADVLVSFYTHQAHDVRYNLPNKICEYMLTGNIIVCPDYPATRDLLNKDNCIFTKPEDSTALAESIRLAITNKDEARDKAIRASQQVREVTFRKVTARLLKNFP